MSLQDLVKAVKDHATENYTKGGWDVIIECRTDDEIAETIQLVSATTPKQAIAAFESAVSVWADRQADARNSADWDVPEPEHIYTTAELIEHAKKDYTPDQWANLPCWFATSAVTEDACHSAATTFVHYHGFLCDWHGYAVTHEDEKAAEHAQAMYEREFAIQCPWG